MKSSCLLSTTKINLLKILTFRNVSVIHVISSKIHSITVKCSLYTLQVDCTVFHQVLSNVLRLTFYFSSFSSSHPTYKTTGFPQKEFDLNWEGGSTTNDGVNWTPCTGLLSKHNIQYFFLQLVSQDSAQELFYHIKTYPYPGVSRSEFHVRCLRIDLIVKVWLLFLVLDLEVPTL